MTSTGRVVVNIPNGLIALATQAVVSGSSFLCLILAGRTLSDAELSRYAIGLAVVYSLHGLTGALLLAPARYFAARLSTDDQRRWLTTQWYVYVVATLSLAGMVLLVIMLTDLPSWLGVIPVLLFLHGASEFCRTCLFITRTPAAVLALDGATHTLRACICLCAALTVWTSASGWLLGLAASLIVWPIALQSMLKFTSKQQPSISVSAQDLYQQLRQNWQYGAPIFLESLGSIASTHLLLLLATITLAANEIAALAIATSTLNVLSLAYAGLAAYLIPRAQRTFATQGFHAWRQLMLRYAIPCLAAVVALSTLLILAAPTVVEMLFGEPRPIASNIIKQLAIPWCGFAVASLMASAFHSLGHTHVGVTAKILTGVMAPLTLLPLAWGWGLNGVLLVYGAIPLSWCVIYFRALPILYSREST